jgi:hypothetical protein
MNQYKIINFKDNNHLNGYDFNIINLTNDTVFPPDNTNTDYQAYLQWLAEGNEPLPADESPQEEPST